jgi:hypothetical protein
VPLIRFGSPATYKKRLENLTDALVKIDKDLHIRQAGR